MPGRSFQPNEVSSGGVVVRPGSEGPLVCLVDDGRYWGIPKGNVERGESPQAAALREIHEEVGLASDELSVLAEIAPSEYVYRRSGRLIFKRVHQFVIVAVPTAVLRPDGHEIVAAEWLTFEAARRRTSFDDTRRALDAAWQIITEAAQPAP